MATNNSNVPAAQPKTGLAAFNAMIKSQNTTDYLKSVLGVKKDAFVNNLTSLVGNSTALQNCERQSVLYAAIKATALNLPFDPNLGFCYVIPYQDRKNNITLGQFQMGYKGFVQLAARGGEIERMNVTDVRAGELWSRDRKTGENVYKWIEDDAERAKAKIVGYLGYIRLRNGYEKEVYKSIEEIEAHAKKYSQTYRSGYGNWKDNFDAMAKKTIIKMMLSKGDVPMSIEMQNAQMFDQAVFRSENASPEYIDNSDDAYDSAQSDKAAKILGQAFAETEEVKEEPEPESESETKLL